ncbi:hypothetical protein [Carnobacterium maltaromaticum]|nr:hypothetical protein [Carnobacterium maltaromaticum]CAD5903060.1 hypothetical protein CMALT394_610014 [Carnobacterium maltaromaticum]
MRIPIIVTTKVEPDKAKGTSTVLMLQVLSEKERTKIKAVEDTDEEVEL